MSRSVHLVGTVPGETAEAAMREALDRLGPRLERITDGETDLRAWWIRAHVSGFYGHPGLEIVRDGDYSTYEQTPQWKVRDGRTLTSDSVDERLVQYAAFARSYPVFRRLREEYGYEDLDFQVGVPTHLDLAMTSFSEPFAPAVYEPLLAGTVAHLERIVAEAGDDVVFQLETVPGLVMIAFASPEERREVAADVAGRLIELPERMPAGTRFGVHLCLGDMNHTARGHMTDAAPIVLLANEIARQWPQGRRLEFIHAPFAAAHEPPAAEEAYYAPLSGLDLPSDVTFYAGCIHESLGHDDQRRLVELIDGCCSRSVGLAAACGLGRRPNIDEAWDAIAKAAELAR